ncbi:GIY-YIG nuclease family protein [Nostoc sp. UHCC 0302]|uniref:GIY-YIG nuclease family protein n=1 Tax=Nostoc sp. UHCC 0302 TaxID=3134896 RepID=UPI00311CC069
MATETNFPSLATLEYTPYIDDTGQLPEQFQGKIGVYAIFDQEKVLQFIGYSRDIYLSLKQHLVRQPQQCYWVKAQTIERPSRTVLESIENAWIAENGSMPVGNGNDKEKWTQPIDVKVVMTPEEQARYQNPMNDELSQIKIIKNVARRVEAEILTLLETRGLQIQFRFNPKLKEEGLLDLK